MGKCYPPTLHTRSSSKDISIDRSFSASIVLMSGNDHVDYWRSIQAIWNGIEPVRRQDRNRGRVGITAVLNEYSSDPHGYDGSSPHFYSLNLLHRTNTGGKLTGKVQVSQGRD